MIPVTMVLTSSGRHDLLQRTLASFFSVNDYPLKRIIIAEDGDDRGVFAVASKFSGQPIEVMFHGRHIGQRPSIDRAYAAVDTEYIFHCENDYEFGRPGIVRESVAILEAEPRALMVLPRNRSELPYYLNSVPVREVDGARYRLVGPNLHHKWYTFSFNPGLRRLSDYRSLPGGYAAFDKEWEISWHYKREGRAMAVLEDGQARHIARHQTTGGSRSGRSIGLRLTELGYSLQRRGAHYLRLIGIGDGSE